MSRNHLSGGEALGEQRGSDGTSAATVSHEFREGQKPPTPQELKEAKARIAALEAESAELTKALTGLTCGGSEFFIRRGKRYVADIDACVTWVLRAKQDAHRRALDAIKARRVAEDEAAAWKADAATAHVENEKLKASLLEAVEALEPFAAACDDCDEGAVDDHGHCWESGMAMAVSYGDFRRAAQVHARLSLEGGEGSGWLPIESAKPKEYERILVATADTPPVVGEAWWREENGKLDLWWAGTGPDDYYADQISQQNQRITHWRPLPPPPEHQSVGGE